MPTSCRQQVVEAALVVLSTISVTVELNRRVPLAADEIPRVLLFEGDEIPLNDFSSMDVYELPFAVQAAVAGSGADAAGAANALRAEIQQKLAADRGLGGKVRTLEFTDAGDWIGVETPVDVEGFVFGFKVQYATRVDDPFTFENE